MAKPWEIELSLGDPIPILFEDRSVLAIDKPAGWLLAPSTWRATKRNLQLAIESSIRAGDFWARSRNLKYLRFVHRLDAETSGILLCAKSPGAMTALSRMFETRAVEKIYWAVVPSKNQVSGRQWKSTEPLSPSADGEGKMKVDPRHGKSAETDFRVLQINARRALVEASPVTGRTHQIRVHLAHAGSPVIGDEMYGGGIAPAGLGLRAVQMAYRDPFTSRSVKIRAATAEFCRAFQVEPGP